MTEKEIQNRIMLKLSEAGCVVYRNETAGVWAGHKIGTTTKGDAVLRDAKPMLAGLCKGSADIIGIAPDGRFLAVEVKTPKGRPSAEQINFIDVVNRSGGIAGIARSPEDALDLIGYNR